MFRFDFRKTSKFLTGCLNHRFLRESQRYCNKFDNSFGSNIKFYIQAADEFLFRIGGRIGGWRFNRFIRWYEILAERLRIDNCVVIWKLFIFSISLASYSYGNFGSLLNHIQKSWSEFCTMFFVNENRINNNIQSIYQRILKERLFEHA